MSQDRRRWMSHLKKESEFTSMEWMMPTPIGEGRSFLCLLIEVPSSSGNTLTDTPEIMF